MRICWLLLDMWLPTRFGRAWHPGWLCILIGMLFGSESSVVVWLWPYGLVLWCGRPGSGDASGFGAGCGCLLLCGRPALGAMCFGLLGRLWLLAFVWEARPRGELWPFGQAVPAIAARAPLPQGAAQPSALKINLCLQATTNRLPASWPQRPHWYWPP